MYYYNFKDPVIWKVENSYYIKEKSKTYIFKPSNIVDVDLLNQTNNDKSYYNLIKNKDGNFLTFYKGDNYILIIVNNDVSIDYKEILKFKNVKYFYQNNWKDLWAKKIDYINNIIENENKNGKYNILIEARDYYIGMAENAILFLEYNKEKVASENVTLCRKRITNRAYRMPDNVIVDNKERDIAEYIKYLFFEKKQTLNEILDFLNHINFNKINIYLIYSRLLFPTYYFDLFEKEKLNNKNNQAELNFVVKNTQNYEKMLKLISDNYLDNINEIEWLKKTKV